MSAFAARSAKLLRILKTFSPASMSAFDIGAVTGVQSAAIPNPVSVAPVSVRLSTMASQ